MSTRTSRADSVCFFLDHFSFRAGINQSSACTSSHKCSVMLHFNCADCATVLCVCVFKPELNSGKLSCIIE